MDRAAPARIVLELGRYLVAQAGWYLTTVKLDLEARNIIERIPNKSPQQLRLV